MNLTDIQTIEKLLSTHNLSAKKHFGQNFLIDAPALEAIVSTANISHSDHIVEIGPGLGVLTQELCKLAQQVTAVELDSTLLPVLKETLSQFDNYEILNQDALTFTPPQAPYKVTANIPYNITSPLLNHFLQAPTAPKTMTLLVQKEVAEKICLKEPKMSVLSLQVHLFAKPELVAIVPSKSFYPPPKVDSALIHLNTHSQYTLDIAKNILKTAKQAFKQGRKKLANTLPNLKERLTQLNLDQKRPQHLSIEDWISIIN